MFFDELGQGGGGSLLEVLRSVLGDRMGPVILVGRPGMGGRSSGSSLFEPLDDDPLDDLEDIAGGRHCAECPNCGAGGECLAGCERKKLVVMTLKSGNGVNAAEKTTVAIDADTGEVRKSTIGFKYVPVDPADLPADMVDDFNEVAVLMKQQLAATEQGRQLDQEIKGLRPEIDLNRTRLARALREKFPQHRRRQGLSITKDGNNLVLLDNGEQLQAVNDVDGVQELFESQVALQGLVDDLATKRRELTDVKQTAQELPGDIEITWAAIAGRIGRKHPEFYAQLLSGEIHYSIDRENGEVRFTKRVEIREQGDTINDEDRQMLQVLLARDGRTAELPGLQKLLGISADPKELLPATTANSEVATTPPPIETSANE